MLQRNCITMFQNWEKHDDMIFDIYNPIYMHGTAFDVLTLS